MRGSPPLCAKKPIPTAKRTRQTSVYKVMKFPTGAGIWARQKRIHNRCLVIRESRGRRRRSARLGKKTPISVIAPALYSRRLDRRGNGPTSHTLSELIARGPRMPRRGRHRGRVARRRFSRVASSERIPRTSSLPSLSGFHDGAGALRLRSSPSDLNFGEFR